MYRGQRRVIRRRKQRMNAVRALLNEHGLLRIREQDALRFQGIDPWDVRAKATEKLISTDELAVALGHIARHRGFKSNAKSRGENDRRRFEDEEGHGRNPGEDGGPHLRPADRHRRRICRTQAQPRRRLFPHTAARDLEAEVRAIFSAQRRLHNPVASQALETGFIDKAFFQRGLQDSEQTVGRLRIRAGREAHSQARLFLRAVPLSFAPQHIRNP